MASGPGVSGPAGQTLVAVASRQCWWLWAQLELSCSLKKNFRGEQLRTSVCALGVEVSFSTTNRLVLDQGPILGRDLVCPGLRTRPGFGEAFSGPELCPWPEILVPFSDLTFLVTTFFLVEGLYSVAEVSRG